MSTALSTLSCTLIWTGIMLWLAAPIGHANVIVALIGGILSGLIFLQARSARSASKLREGWTHRGGPRYYVG